MRPAHVLLVLATACGDNATAQDDRVINPPRAAYNSWIEIQPQGVVCGNDTQYKFWVNYSNTSDNLVVVFEPGGACWDYPGCTGAAGELGVANLDGLPDDHYSLAPFISPFLNRSDDTSPSQLWNMVYVPYCTGDVHTGNVVATYSDDAGHSVDFHHDGHAAVAGVTTWIDSNFTHVPKMLVTGCSAGGVGALVNYHFLRNGVHAAEKGYLFDDSGPVFPDPSNSTPMHQKIRQAWNLDSLTPDFPASFTLDDMGTINTTLADEFPHDRLAITYFERDDDFTHYSYDEFYNHPDHDALMALWAADTMQLTAQYATRPNLFYYLPYWRDINNSHCTTVISFVGSDFADGSMTLAQWVNDFVADHQVESMIEPPVPGEDPQ